MLPRRALHRLEIGIHGEVEPKILAVREVVVDRQLEISLSVDDGLGSPRGDLLLRHVVTVALQEGMEGGSQNAFAFCCQSLCIAGTVIRAAGASDDILRIAFSFSRA